MKRPFVNAYEKIKKLSQGLFKKKTEVPEEAAETTETSEESAIGAEEEQQPASVSEPEPKAKAAPEPAPKEKEDDQAKLEQVLHSIAEEEGIKEENKSKGEIDEQKKYEAKL